MASLDFTKARVMDLLNGGVLEAQVDSLRDCLPAFASTVRKRAPWGETKELLIEIDDLAKLLLRKLDALTTMAAQDIARRDAGELLQTAYDLEQDGQVRGGLSFPVHDGSLANIDAIAPLIEELEKLIVATPQVLRELTELRDGRLRNGGAAAIGLMHLCLCVGWHNHAIRYGVPSTPPDAALALVVEVCFEAVGTDISVEWALRQFAKQRPQAIAQAEFWKAETLAHINAANRSGEET